jgi:hypothetical protein
MTATTSSKQTNEASILELEVETNNIMKDLRDRINRMFDRYTNAKHEIPKLPDFDDLLNNNRLHYNTSKNLTDLIDELLDLKLRVNIVKRSFDELSNMKLQAVSRNEYTFLGNFRNNLKKYDEELTSYKFELADLVKNANNKLRVLESVSFYNE